MKKVIGGLILAAGILIAGASGLCTAALLISSFMSGEGIMGNMSDFMGSLIMVGIFGGIPFAGGLGMFFLGRSLLRDGSVPPPNPN